MNAPGAICSLISNKGQIMANLRTAPPLSSREKECLLWVAKGKSSWDIETTLGISKNTVNFQLKRFF
ncbi:helix-turn-helix transcriptional regulator [Mesorhizobium sp. M0317]|uniref:helix-turn-helix transcriptional regulator n=1 Tax=Mesorhizobium sp. M0317 TaxID=2956935 RepID=UPI00333CBD6C